MVLALVAAVGCGDDDDSNAGGSEATAETGGLNGKEFSAQANAICLKGREEILGKALAQRQGAGAEAARSELRAARSTLFPSLEDQASQIRELGIPPAVEGKVEAFLRKLERSIEVADENELSKSVLIRKAFEPAGRAAVRAGLASCDYWTG